MSNPEENINSEDLVTEKHVRGLLSTAKVKNVHNVSWKLVSFTKKGDNYASTVSSLKVSYSSNGQEHEEFYVVKLNPRRGIDIHRDITNVIFSKEAKFYLKLLPELNGIMEGIHQPPLKFPRCFYSSLDMRKEQIYFEDLRRRNFEMFDRRKGMDVPHATLVLRELGRLHAASLLLQSQSPEPLEVRHSYLNQDWLTFTENARNALLPVLMDGLTHTVKMLERIGGYAKAISWVESLKDQIEDMVTNQMRNGKYDVVCHGDCWNNNILFKYDSKGVPAELMLLDLQICRKASPATDLNQFMYTSLTSEVRRPNVEGFLKEYYIAFKQVMDAGGAKMPFTEEEIKEEYCAKNKFGAMFAMFSIPIVLMESDEVPDINKGDHDIKAIMEEMREKALSMLHTNPMLKPRFLATFDEFMDSGLIP